MAASLELQSLPLSLDEAIELVPLIEIELDLKNVWIWFPDDSPEPL